MAINKNKNTNVRSIVGGNGNTAYEINNSMNIVYEINNSMDTVSEMNDPLSMLTDMNDSIVKVVTDALTNHMEKHMFNSALLIIKQDGGCSNIVCSMCDLCTRTTNKFSNRLSGHISIDRSRMAIKRMAVEYLIEVLGEQATKELLIEVLV